MNISFLLLQFTGVKAELPMNVHLLTLSALGDYMYLLRLEHQFEVDEGTLGKPVNVSLSVSPSVHCQ